MYITLCMTQETSPLVIHCIIIWRGECTEGLHNRREKFPLSLHDIYKSHRTLRMIYNYDNLSTCMCFWDIPSLVSCTFSAIHILPFTEFFVCSFFYMLCSIFIVYEKPRLASILAWHPGLLHLHARYVALLGGAGQHFSSAFPKCFTAAK